MIYGKAKRSKRKCDMDRYRLLRNTVVNMPKQSKRRYFKGLPGDVVLSNSGKQSNTLETKLRFLICRWVLWKL